MATAARGGWCLLLRRSWRLDEIGSHCGRESAGGAAPRSLRKVPGIWRGEAVALGPRERCVGQNSPAVCRRPQAAPKPPVPLRAPLAPAPSPRTPHASFSPAPGPRLSRNEPGPPALPALPLAAAGRTGPRARSRVGGGQLEPVGAAPPSPHPRQAAPGGGPGRRGGKPGFCCPQPHTKRAGTRSAALLRQISWRRRPRAAAGPRGGGGGGRRG